MEMGTGKTRAALAYLSERGIRRALIVCPLSVTGVWARESLALGIKTPIALLTYAGSIKAQATYVRGLANDQFIVTNYEAFWREPLRSALRKWAPEAVIIDEAHRIKNRTARQSKFAHQLADVAPVRLALTGTPISNGLQDAWSLFRFVDKRIFGTWPDFERSHLRYGGFRNKQITSYADVELAARKIDAGAFQCSKEEAVELPPRTDTLVPVRLATKTRAVYDEMRKKALVELQREDGTNTFAIARVTLTQILRLQQITGGFLRDVGEEYVDVGTEKAEITRDLLADIISNGQRAVVFTRFLHDIDILQRVLAGMRTARFDGGISLAQREQLLTEFREGRYDALLIQLRTGSEGIDLTAASHAVFYSTGYSLLDFLQARDRLHRIGQTQKVTYHHLIASRTVDEVVYRALSTKTDIARAVTSLSYAMDLFGGAPSPNPR